MAKTAIGAMSIGQAPTQTAMPRVMVTRPRYIGLRLNRYGPYITSLRLVRDVGLTSVSSRRKTTTAQNIRNNAAGYQGNPECRIQLTQELRPAERPANRRSS